MSDAPARRPWPARLLRGLMAVVLVMAAFGAGTIWRLSKGPIALPNWVVEIVEDRLTRALAGPDVTIEGIGLAYDFEDHALGLSLRDGALSDAGVPVLELPRALVTLDGRALARARLRPRDVDLQGLSLDIARDAEGRLSLAFGAGRGDASFPQDWASGLAALDDALAVPLIAELDSVRLGGITLRLRDEITGLAQDVRNGTLTLTRGDQDVRLGLTLSLPTGAGRTARIAAGLSRRTDGAGAEASLALLALPVGYLAEVAPNIPALTLIRGTASATVAMSVTEAGEPGAVRGRVEVSNPQMMNRPERLALDRAVLAVEWVPGSDRIGLSEIVASSDEVLLNANGQILLEDGLTGPIQGQIRFDDIVFDPEDMLERRVAFEDGVFEARLTQQPLALRIGQAMVTGPSGTARLSGRATFPPEGMTGGLRLTIPELAVEDLRALWPKDLQPQARTWFVNNMLGGIARNVQAAVRLAPGQPPDVLANFDYVQGSVRFMRYMPPAENAVGAAQLSGTRLSLRVDAAEVPALGPGAEATGAEGRLRIARTTFVIEDATQRPPIGALRMEASGDIGDTLTLLDNRPLRLLSRLKKDRDFARGTADALVEVRLPLRPGNAPADIDWSVEATLRGVTSDGIVTGRRITADRLTMTATPEAVEIGGDLALDGLPFGGTWRQALPPRGTEPIDPNAPPAPPQPLPEPGRISGVATVTPEALARLGIDLGAFDLAGRTRAQVDITLPAGAPPRLQARSNLEGMSVALPAVSWRKGARRAADLRVEAILSETPRIPSVSFDGPGLKASGEVTLAPGGGLERASFGAVDIGWFRGPLVLTGRGRGAAPAISIRGGRADLRRALLVSESSGGSGGDSSPLDIALDRLTITDGIALTGLRARLRGGAGEFTGAINGGQSINGVLAPQGGGSAVQISSTDAGGVLRSADLFKDARGGSLNLTLRPTGQQGIYAGALRMESLRVRNAPALASLLQALSVVGILEQLGGEGLFFQTVESDFTLRPNDIVVRRASAVGPSMSITADGTFNSIAKTMDMQGVISPIYLVNGLFGALFARRDEGLFGFTYRLRGLVDDPQVSVNPLSILTPGVFREIFRRAPPEG